MDDTVGVSRMGAEDESEKNTGGAAENVPSEGETSRARTTTHENNFSGHPIKMEPSTLYVVGAWWWSAARRGNTTLV